MREPRKRISIQKCAVVFNWILDGSVYEEMECRGITRTDLEDLDLAPATMFGGWLDRNRAQGIQVFEEPV